MTDRINIEIDKLAVIRKSEPPEWHREYLADRQEAVAKGDDYFITLDELEAELRADLERAT